MSPLQHKIKTLLPAYFAMVMATGIISIALFFGGYHTFSYILFYLNLTFLAGLLGMYIYRLVFFIEDLMNDFRSFSKGPGFFTIIAALCIVGNQFILLYRNMEVATILLIVAGISWLIIGYGFFFFITTSKKKKGLTDGINGTWLVIIVAIQALSSLISFLTEGGGEPTYIYLFLALCLFLLGCIFYLYIMSLIIYRLSFFPLNAKELGAPYWINMGATAITTLAGSMLILHTEGFNFIVDLLPFIKGFTLFFWAAGTWWIPLLVLLGMWRHLTQKVPVPTTAEGYDPSYWGMVFPLGMYTVATFRLGEALEVSFLQVIPEFFIYIAILAWLAVSLGFVRHQIHTFLRKKNIKN